MTPDFPCQQVLQTLSQMGEFMPALPWRPGRARLRALSSIGHLVDGYLVACERRVKKAHRPGGGSPWPEVDTLLRTLPENAPVALPEEGLFACALALGPRGEWTLEPVVLPKRAMECLLPVWYRVQPDAPRQLPGLMEIPEAALAPLWGALLHLRPLRQGWERYLRRQHLIRLRGLLPRAWLLDPTPVPPGAVIPGLEVADWAEFIRNAPEEDPSYSLTSAWGEGSWQPASGTSLSTRVEEALREPTDRRAILTKQAQAARGYVFALYRKEKGRTEYVGGVACQPAHTQDDEAPTSGSPRIWRVSRVA